MPSLLLNLVGPQSWGVASRFNVRDTTSEPTESAIFGMIEAAMGLDHSESYPRLDDLRFGVRVDRPGRLSFDYQTAKQVAMANSNGRKNIVRRKYYLADAHFLVVLEGDLPILETIRQALLTPHRPIYLGRRAFAPTAPLILPDSLQSETMETVMATSPWCACHWYGNAADCDGRPLRAVVDDPHGFETRSDRRVGPPHLREFTRRPVRTYLVAPVLVEKIAECTMAPQPDDRQAQPTPLTPIPPSQSSPPLNVSGLHETVCIFRKPTFNPFDGWAMHQILLDALRIGRPRTPVPVVFRVDAIESDRFRLVIRSTRRPDWSRFQPFELVDEITTPFDAPDLPVGTRFQFSTRVNPTKKRNGKKLGLASAPEQAAWLHRKALQRGGFRIVEITNHLQERSRRGKRGVQFLSVVFDGVGEVTDPDLLNACLWCGLSPSGRFAGFNMLEISDAC